MTKTVKIYKDCKFIKQFNCQRAEFSDNGVKFDGVQRKDKTGMLGLFYMGPTFYEVDHLARTASANLLNDGVLISVSW